MMYIQEFTSIGNRKENQDYIAYQMVDDESGIFVVADGMGGYDFGDIAARLVAESIVESVTSNWDNLNEKELLSEAFNFANESLALKRLALECKKMGTCVCVLLIRNNNAYISWFGDSRVYQYEQEIESFVTDDHSVVKELSRINALKATDIDKYSNVVTRSIMGSISLDPMEFVVRPIHQGDHFLLCSDGLYKSIPIPLRWDNDLVVKLNSRDNTFNDNATCLFVSI